MTFIYKIVFFISGLVISNIAAATNCDSNCQLDQIQSYFSTLDKISRKGSSNEDIDSLLALMHDDVKYIHVEYQANFNKESWRKAFVRNLKREAYQNTVNNEIRIINTILGKNHIAIEYSHGVIQDNGLWQQTEPLLVLFGFKGGKISLIKELW